MSCGAVVDPTATRCESCYSELDHDVKAFRCPKCGKLLELGVPECPKCSMRFRAKTVRPADREGDEKMLSKLMEMDGASKAEPAPEAGTPPITPEEADAVSGLVRRLVDLVGTEAGIASRAAEARERLSRMADADAASIPVDDLRSELEAIARDLGTMAEIISTAKGLSDDVARTFSMPGPLSMAGGKRLSLDVPAVQGGSGPAEEALRTREEQVRKREEMVDRKIKAYAQKKKELDEAEARPSAAGRPASEPVGEVPEGLGRRLRSIHETISSDGASDDVESCLSSLEGRVRDLVTSRSELEQRVSQLEEGEEEVRALMKVLDGLLGQLPPEVVDQFSKTEEFKLYERVLDRLGV